MESAKLNRHGQVSIPAAVRKAFHLNPGDNVGFEIQEDGNVMLRPIAFVDRRDAWFYAPEVREAVQVAEQEIEEGQGQEFENATEAIKWLKK